MRNSDIDSYSNYNQYNNQMNNNKLQNENGEEVHYQNS